MAVSGDTIRVDINGFTALGDGLGMYDGGEVHVGGAVPGEVVLAREVRRRRSYVYALAADIVQPSPHRVPARCEHFGACTGCQWQHIAYPRQLELKREAVGRLLSRAGADPAKVGPVMSADVPWHYRNHARFTVDRVGSVGFVNRETRRLVRITSCRIMHPWINSALSQMQDRCRGRTQVSVRYGVNTGSWLVQPRLDLADLDFETGQQHYWESIHGSRLRISSPAFFQVNVPQAERMISRVLEWVRPQGDEVVVDAYAGVGTFALAMSPHVGRVVAIEESASAVKDAEVNVQGVPNIELVRGKVEDVLPQWAQAPDLVVLDPPRAGCHKAVLDTLTRYRPERVVYVSCDPETLARDMAVLCREAYEVVEVQPVDMFPQTFRVECLAYLRTRGAT